MEEDMKTNEPESHGVDGSEGQRDIELEELKAKCAEFENGWKRALADYDNLKKDLGRERQQMRQSANEEAAESIIPVLDNFDQAVRFQPEDLDDKAKNWLAGILHVRTQLEEVLKGFGAEPIGEIGDAFDPNVHEAVSEKSEESAADGAILDVVHRGWKMGEKMLRPAKVVINNLTPKS